MDLRTIALNNIFTVLFYRFACIYLTVLLSACSTSLHGSFVTTSYEAKVGDPVATELGSAEGRSCQTRILYIFPSGDSPTTDAAIENAKNVHQGTRFITDESTYSGRGRNHRRFVRHRNRFFFDHRRRGAGPFQGVH